MFSLVSPSLSEMQRKSLFCSSFGYRSLSVSNFLWITRLIHHPMNLERFPFFSLLFIIFVNRSFVCCLPFSSFFPLLFILFLRSAMFVQRMDKRSPIARPLQWGAANRSQMKESCKWNRVLLFRRIELLSARARA